MLSFLTLIFWLTLSALFFEVLRETIFGVYSIDFCDLLQLCSFWFWFYNRICFTSLCRWLVGIYNSLDALWCFKCGSLIGVSDLVSSSGTGISSSLLFRKVFNLEVRSFVFWNYDEHYSLLSTNPNDIYDYWLQSPSPTISLWLLRKWLSVGNLSMTWSLDLWWFDCYLIGLASTYSYL